MFGQLAKVNDFDKLPSCIPFNRKKKNAAKIVVMTPVAVSPRSISNTVLAYGLPPRRRPPPAWSSCRQLSWWTKLWQLRRICGEPPPPLPVRPATTRSRLPSSWVCVQKSRRDGRTAAAAASSCQAVVLIKSAVMRTRAESSGGSWWKPGSGGIGPWSSERMVRVDKIKRKWTFSTSIKISKKFVGTLHLHVWNVSDVKGRGLWSTISLKIVGIQFNFRVLCR